VLVLCAGNTNIDGLRAGCFQLRLGLLHFHIGSNASGKPTLDHRLTAAMPAAPACAWCLSVLAVLTVSCGFL
jgi:hypothetical protein